MTNSKTFKSLNLSANTLTAIKKKGFNEPTPIQAQIIPLLLSGHKDIIGQAQTGTGKTAAFGIPLIEKLAKDNHTVQALILVPTRELANQVAEEIKSLQIEKRLHIAAIYGGQSMSEQIRQLKKGVAIVVGTPGRVLDHIRRKTLNLNKLSYLVLDEADEMLKMGFSEDIELILADANPKRRTLLFSATMPKPILRIAEKYMREKEMISIKKQQLTTNLTNQVYFEVRESEKLDALCRIIESEDDFYGVVFCRTKSDVDNTVTRLLARGYHVEGLHGDINQAKREKILKKFKSQEVNILLATDVAARGLDVNNLTHVVNYAIPRDPEVYVHRIGRTGRAGKQGMAITFVAPSEARQFGFIKKITGTDIKRYKLPSVVEIANKQVNKLQVALKKIIGKSQHQSYEKMAGELLRDDSAKNVVAALLHYMLQK